MKRRFVFSFFTVFAFIIGLFIVASFNVERLMKSTINHYLAPFDTQVTQVEVSPRSLTQWSIPTLSLKINQNRVQLKNIDIHFKTDTSLFQLSAADLSQIDIHQADIEIETTAFKQRLTQWLFTEPNTAPANPVFSFNKLDASLALWLTQLPQLNIGKTRFHLHQATPADNIKYSDKNTGIETWESSQASDGSNVDIPQFNLDYLHLNQGKLTAELSIKNKSLLSINATLMPKQWQVSSTLSLTQLDRVLSTLKTMMTSLSSHSDPSKKDVFSQWYSSLNASAFPHSGSLYSQLTLQFPNATDINVVNTSVANINAANTKAANTKTTDSSTTHSNLYHTRINLQSVHQLCDANFNFPPSMLKEISSSLNTVNLTQADDIPLLIASLADTKPQEEQKHKQGQCQTPDLDFSVSGPIQNLNLSIQPASLTLSPNDAQIAALVSRFELPPELLSLLSLFNNNDHQESLSHGEASPLLSLTIERPLTLNLASKQLSLPQTRAEIDLARLKAVVHVSDLVITPKKEHKITSTPSITTSSITDISVLPPITAKWVIAVDQKYPMTLNTQTFRAPSVTAQARSNMSSYDLSIDRYKLSSRGAFTQQKNDNLIQYLIQFDSPITMNTGQITLDETPTVVLATNAKDSAHTKQAHFIQFDAAKSQFTIAAGSTLLYQPNKQIELTLSPAHVDIAQASTLLQTRTVTKKPSSLTATHATPAEPSDEVNIMDYQGSAAHLHLGLSKPVILTHSLQPLVTQHDTQATDSSEKIDKEIVDKKTINAGYLKAPALNHLLASLATPMNEQLTVIVDQLLVNKVAHQSSIHPKINTLVQQKGKNKVQEIIRLKQAKLTQSIHVEKKLISTQEAWQLNALALSSEHQLHLDPTTSPTLLTGKWRFTQPLNELVLLLKETSTTPLDVDVTGMSHFQLNYQQNQQNQQKTLSDKWTFTLAANLNDIAGQFNQLPFEGGTLHATCHYALPYEQAKYNINDENRSPLDCSTLNLSMAAFNPGIMITELNIQAKLAPLSQPSLSSPIISPENHQSAWQALWKQLGLNHTQLQLSLKGDTLEGQLQIPKFILNTKGDTEADILLQGVSLKQLLTLHPVTGVYADGIFDAVLPVIYNQGKLRISGGELIARPPGGLIAINGNPSVEQMKLSQPYLDFAFSALQHLEYSELSSHFDMDPNGDAILKAQVKGQSEGIERPIHFNYTQEENLLQLLRSLQISGKLQTQIEQAMQSPKK
ncbi:YdbH domain-containing protein [Shewanella surugensis]|uniref:YdbH domain-containing protein n=1 Tax=Shewanella surugensis TaxID=212020 RepID=A0ABT0L6Q1_9GAMM|nr:YdbH domain-containing protein [Shewanella surugensis]MCL1123249.1 YdbH domain-containing protein [Shewanella surugensis]